MQRAYLASTACSSALMLLGLGVAMVASTLAPRRRGPGARRGPRRDARRDRRRRASGSREGAAEPVSRRDGGRGGARAGRGPRALPDAPRLRASGRGPARRIARGLGEPALFAITAQRDRLVDLLLGARRRGRRRARAHAGRVLRRGPVLRDHDGHLRGGQLAPPGARRRLHLRPLRLRRVVELRRGLGDPARLPDRHGARGGGDLATTWPLLGRARRRLRGDGDRGARDRCSSPCRTSAGCRPTGWARCCACRSSASACSWRWPSSRSPRYATRVRSSTPSTWARRPTGRTRCSRPWSPPGR